MGERIKSSDIDKKIGTVVNSYMAMRETNDQ